MSRIIIARVAVPDSASTLPSDIVLAHLPGNAVTPFVVCTRVRDDSPEIPGSCHRGDYAATIGEAHASFLERARDAHSDVKAALDALDAMDARREAFGGWTDDTIALPAAKPAITFDMTPTWEETAGVLAALIQNGDTDGRRYAMAELRRMGRLADFAMVVMGGHRRADAPAIPEAEAIRAKLVPAVPAVEGAPDMKGSEGVRYDVREYRAGRWFSPLAGSSGTLEHAKAHRDASKPSALGKLYVCETAITNRQRVVA